MSSEPLSETYSRVTNPERFDLLHIVAEEAIAQLRNEFSVDIVEASPSSAVLRDLVDAKKVRKSVKITPRSAQAAPIQITFTDFPGLIVGYGYGVSTAYPACGCDACGETVEHEAARLMSMVQSVVEGRFREERAGFLGRFHKHEFIDVRGNIVSGGTRLVPLRERSFFGKQHRIWNAWPKRSMRGWTTRDQV